MSCSGILLLRFAKHESTYQRNALFIPLMLLLKVETFYRTRKIILVLDE
jgi:hypothetical protein